VFEATDVRSSLVSKMMAWFCSGKSNLELVNNLKSWFIARLFTLLDGGIITNTRVLDAMQKVDRGMYCQESPYKDSPQPIGFNATISAPHMHAYALEALEPNLKPGMKALDVGHGSGYLVACMAEMVGPTGKVVGIEHVDQLTQKSIKNVNNDKPELLTSGRVKLITGDGRKGFKEESPYDAIHVGAAYDGNPVELLEQLNEGGRMFIPLGDSEQQIVLYHKENGKIKAKSLMGVRYVPLTSLEQQLR
jgi:protein-L-isoaspartate(D-aspartate) O-methyltransferase